MELNTPQQFFADRYAGTVGGPNGATSRFAPVCISQSPLRPDACEVSFC